MNAVIDYALMIYMIALGAYTSLLYVEEDREFYKRLEKVQVYSNKITSDMERMFVVRLTLALWLLGIGLTTLVVVVSFFRGLMYIPLLFVGVILLYYSERGWKADILALQILKGEVRIEEPPLGV